MGELVDSVVFEIAENIAEHMGLTIPAPALVQVAGALVATEALKNALDFLIPSATHCLERLAWSKKSICGRDYYSSQIYACAN